MNRDEALKRLRTLWGLWAPANPTVYAEGNALLAELEAAAPQPVSVQPILFARDGDCFMVSDPKSPIRVRPRSPHMRALWQAVCHPGAIVFPFGKRQAPSNFSQSLTRAREQIAAHSPALAAELLSVHRVWGRALRYDPTGKQTIHTRVILP